MEQQNSCVEAGRRIKRVREEQELSLAEFGRELGITKSMVYNIESGRVPAKESILRLISYRFFVRMDFLLKGEEPVYEAVKGLELYLKGQGAVLEEVELIEAVFSLPRERRSAMLDRMRAYLKIINSPVKYPENIF